MKKLALIVFLLALPLCAKEKPQHVYQEGTLTSFQSITTGSRCGNAVCRDIDSINYSIQVDDHTYVVRQASHFGSNDLKHQLPGTKVLVRIDSKGLYIKLGDQESKFAIVEARQ